MGRTRILLVPEFTELEWTIKPRLEEWAEVATYDSPGVGAEAVSEDELELIASDAAVRRARIAERGLEEVERRGWDRFVVVADSGGGPPACALAAARPEAVEAIVLGHACLTLNATGERAPINPEVHSALTSLIGRDHEQFVRHALTQITGGAYDEELARKLTERVPLKLLTRAWLQGSDEPVDALIGALDCPLLLVKHEGCLMYTEEGFEDVVRALPRARATAVADKPSVSDEFAVLLREFCETTEPVS